MKTHLLLIDPQIDFMDLPGSTLPVTGAVKDMQRVSAFIDRMGQRLYDIHVTLDSHHACDIAHKALWRNKNGDYPAPFTIIGEAEIKNKVWYARMPQMQAILENYVLALSSSGRYPLCIWPDHCLIGTPGAAIQEDVRDSLNAWARGGLQMVDFVAKGTNWKTEHYSAVMAEVPDNQDPTTTLNWGLINILQEADQIVIAGEALSHCVANTVRDIANNFGDANITKMVLLEDCSSPVTGFEKLGLDFIYEMKARGMKTAKSTDLYV
jgi:nicotinamidase-related amidase